MVGTIKRSSVLLIPIALTLGGCGNSSDGKEPTESGCDKNPQSIAIKAVNGDGLKGTLVVRKANPSDCDRTYWGWFDPDDSLSSESTHGWELTFWSDKKTTPVQYSEPGNPLVTAWTTVLHVEKGTNVWACVRDMDSGREYCTDKVQPA